MTHLLVRTGCIEGGAALWEGLYNNPSTMAHLNCLVNGPRSIVSEAPYSTVDLIRGYCICKKSAAQLARGYVDINRRKPRHRQRASWQRRQLSSQGKSYAARGLLMAATRSRDRSFGQPVQ